MLLNPNNFGAKRLLNIYLNAYYLKKKPPISRGLLRPEISGYLLEKEFKHALPFQLREISLYLKLVWHKTS